MKLPNPNTNIPFSRVITDQEGNKEWGYRTVDGQEEIVHIPSNRSNMEYWQLEPVLSPENHTHSFIFTDIAKREIECESCHYPTSFNAGTEYFEDNGAAFVVIKKRKYPVSL